MPNINPEESGGEDWLQQQVGDITPAVSEVSQPYAELSLALGLTHDDYLKEPEAATVNLVGARLGISFDGDGGGLTEWHATHVYGGKLVVQELEGNKHVRRWLVGGSLYMPAGREKIASMEEQEQLGVAVWTNRNTIGISTETEETPAMIVPGVICRDAMLSLKQLYSVNELRANYMVGGLMKEPKPGFALALTEGGDKRPLVYFLDDEVVLTPRVVALGRLVGRNFYTIFQPGTTEV